MKSNRASHNPSAHPKSSEWADGITFVRAYELEKTKVELNADNNKRAVGTADAYNSKFEDDENEK